MQSNHNAPAPPTVRAKSWLDAALKDAGKSNRWLAGRVKVDETTISKYRNGLTPRKDIQEKIARVLGKTAQELGW